jgi:hypothetical protein
VPVVVAVNFGVAFEADCYRVRDLIRAALGRRHHVVGFDLYAAEPMTNAAASVAVSKQLLDVSRIELPHDPNYGFFAKIA